MNAVRPKHVILSLDGYTRCTIAQPLQIDEHIYSGPQCAFVVSYMREYSVPCNTAFPAICQTILIVLYVAVLCVLRHYLYSTFRALTLSSSLVPMDLDSLDGGSL